MVIVVIAVSCARSCFRRRERVSERQVCLIPSSSMPVAGVDQAAGGASRDVTQRLLRMMSALGERETRDGEREEGREIAVGVGKRISEADNACL